MTLARRALLYFYTARHLSATQLLYWPLRKVQRWFSPPPRRISVRPSTEALERIRSRIEPWFLDDPGRRLDRADEVMEGSFAFLNHSERMGRVDWTARPVSHLWTYHLQYFDYALDLAVAARHRGDDRYVRQFVDLARGWIEQTVGGQGDGWDPYVISVRSVNWIFALALLGDRVPASDVELIGASIGSQLDRLERRLELHLGANHLLRNYRALLIGGVAFDGARAQRWSAIGARGLEREANTQVLADGGHHERSPMYHAAVLSDCLECLDIARASGRPLNTRFLKSVEAMLGAFAVLCRDDGKLHLFNDAANDLAPSRAEIETRAQAAVGCGVPMAQGSLALPVAGYFGFADARNGDRILVDCGPVGAPEQPGHAHCDMLSFELDIAGGPVIVDSGTAGYEGEPLREYQRGTRAHNTVMIGDRDQSEMWGTFRVARRALPEAARIEQSESGWRFSGGCRHYHAPEAVHRRAIERLEAGAWRIADRVAGAEGAPIRSFFHLHPDFEITVDGLTIHARAKTRSVRLDFFAVDELVVASGGDSEAAVGWYSPEFGLRIPSPTLVASLHANDGREFGVSIRVAG